LNWILYYPEHLFPDFFEAAKSRLSPDGKLVIIFSNLAQLTKVTETHPIETEIAKNERFQLEKKFRSSRTLDFNAPISELIFESKKKRTEVRF